MLVVSSNVQVEVELGPQSLALLSDIANSLRRIAAAAEDLTFKRITSIQLNLPGTEGGQMPFQYKADKPDFDIFVTLPGQDSEGNTIPDINIPTGQTLTVVSDDPLGLAITPDPLNPKHFSIHVGEPNTDETPRPVNVTAELTRDSDGSVVLSASDSGTVTVGDAVGDPTAINIGLPAS